MPLGQPAARIDPRACTHRWCCLDRCRAWPIKDALAAWAADAIVWDGHGAHTARLLADLPVAHVPLSAYSPELNSSERVFDEIHLRAEGRAYSPVAEKEAIVDVYLRDFAADPCASATSYTGIGSPPRSNSPFA